MLARYNNFGSVVLLLVTSYPTIDGLFDNRNLVLVRARNTRFLAAGVNAHGCILDVGVHMQVGYVHFPDI